METTAKTEIEKGAAKEEPEQEAATATEEAAKVESESKNVDVAKEPVQEGDTLLVPKEETETKVSESSNPSDTCSMDTSTEKKSTTEGSTTERKKWDFSNRRVMVRNIMKFMDTKRQRVMVDDWVAGTENKIKVTKFKKPPQGDWIVVTLEEENQVPILIEYVNNNLTNKKGEKLYAHPVTAFDDKRNVDNDGEDGNDDNGDDGRRIRKRGSRDDNGGETKRQRQQKLESQVSQPRIVTEEEIKNAIIPLWRSSYDEQLRAKEKEMIKKCAIKVVKEIKDKFRQLDKEAKRNKQRKPVKPYAWLDVKRTIEVQPILQAKSIVRNKCEFTFGYRYVADENAKNCKMEGKMEDSIKDTAMDTSESSTPKEEGKMEDSIKDTPMETSESSIPKEESDEKETTGQEQTAIPQKIPSVGAMVRGWSGGVSHPRCCPNIQSEALALVDIVETFLADCPMPPYDSKLHRGFWRTMTVRSSRRTKECMLIFVHAPLLGGEGSKDDDEIDNYPPEVFESEKARLTSMLTGKDLPVTYPKLEENEEAADPQPDTEQQSFLQVTSIFFQEFGGISLPGPDHPVQHVFGEKSLKEKLGKLTVNISPGAFFQVNTDTAETLYNVVVEKVREVTAKPEETLCFDVCCGTGTIGLTLMKEGVVGKVIGVDISGPAIEDAKINARLNGFETDDTDEGSGDNSTRFVAARAEHVMQKEIGRYIKSGSSGKVVAVVDPAREGLHNDVVKALRSFSRIDRLIYVSCNPTGSLVKDAGLLCTPATKRYKGRPFRPTFCQPVDMFPYSNHCEMVVVFDRLTDEELGDGKD